MGGATSSETSADLPSSNSASTDSTRLPAFFLFFLEELVEDNTLRRQSSKFVTLSSSPLIASAFYFVTNLS